MINYEAFGCLGSQNSLDVLFVTEALKENVEGGKKDVNVVARGVRLSSVLFYYSDRVRLTIKRQNTERCLRNMLLNDLPR